MSDEEKKTVKPTGKKVSKKVESSYSGDAEKPKKTDQVQVYFKRNRSYTLEALGQTYRFEAFETKSIPRAVLGTEAFQRHSYLFVVKE